VQSGIALSFPLVELLLGCFLPFLAPELLLPRIRLAFSWTGRESFASLKAPVRVCTWYVPKFVVYLQFVLSMVGVKVCLLSHNRNKILFVQMVRDFCVSNRVFSKEDGFF